MSYSQTRSAGQHFTGCRIENVLSLEGWRVIMWNAFPWTIVGNMFGECHAHCRLKTSLNLLPLWYLQTLLTIDSRPASSISAICMTRTSSILYINYIEMREGIAHEVNDVHELHLSHCSSYKPGDMWRMREIPRCAHDKWNISMVTCDTNIHCVVCPDIYVFWLPLWYLQTLLTIDSRPASSISAICRTRTSSILYMTNEENTAMCSRQVEHIHGHLWHNYSAIVN
jgi:hypothetical protein